MKEKVKIYMSIVAFIFSLIVGVTAMFLPPMGVIDPSILWYTAQLLVFVAGLLGFSIRYDALNQIAETLDRKSTKDHEHEMEGEC